MIEYSYIQFTVPINAFLKVEIYLKIQQSYANVCAKINTKIKGCILEVVVGKYI